MVSVRFALSLKSSSDAGNTGTADTVTVVALADRWSSRARTLTGAPPSWRLAGSSVSVTFGVGSLSTMVSVAGLTRNPVALPATVSVSPVSSRSSVIVARKKLAVPDAVCAGIVNCTSATPVKSSPATAVPFSTDIVTTVSADRT